jgi:hypothetical protein
LSSKKSQKYNTAVITELISTGHAETLYACIAGRGLFGLSISLIPSPNEVKVFWFKPSNPVGCAFLSWETAADNARAQRFYDKMIGIRGSWVSYSIDLT